MKSRLIKTNYILRYAFLFGLFVLICCPVHAYKLKVVSTTESICSQDGTIVLQITDDAGNGIGAAGYTALNGPQFQVVDYSPNFAAPNSVNGDVVTLTEIAAGTYRVDMKYSDGTGEHIISTAVTKTVLVPGNYTLPTIRLKSAISSLNCRNSGQVTVTVAGGKKNYTLTLTPKPSAGYTNVATMTATGDYAFSNLPAGTYSVKVEDNCFSSAQVSNIAVDNTVKDFVTPSSMPVLSLSRYEGANPACDMVTYSFYGDNDAKNLNLSPTYWPSDPTIGYYDINLSSSPAVPAVNDPGWKPYQSGKQPYELTQSYGAARTANEKLYMHLRVTGGDQSLPGCTQVYPVSFAPILPVINRISANCITDKFTFSPPAPGNYAYQWIVCYPYELYVFDNASARNNAASGQGGTVGSGGLMFYESIDDDRTTTVSGLNSGSTYYLRMIDASGAIYDRDIQMKTQSAGAPSVRQLNSYCPSQGNYIMDNGSLIASAQNSTNGMVAGTTIQLVAYPSGVPAGWLTKMQANNPHTMAGNTNFSIFRWEEISLATIYDYFSGFPEGIYTFIISEPCQTPKTVTVNYVYPKATYNGYSTKLTCKGLEVMFNGGSKSWPSDQLNMEGVIQSANTDSKVYYHLVDGYPANILDKFDQQMDSYFSFSGAAGEKITLPVPGVYKFIPVFGSASTQNNCPIGDTLIFDFTRPLMAIDVKNTYAYACPSSPGLGVISVHAANGIGDLTYEFMSSVPNETPFPAAVTKPEGDNTPALFSFGTVGTTYTLKITDGCNTSTQVNLTAKDLSLGGFLQTNSSGNRYCIDDNIIITCVSFPGTVAYQWYTVIGATGNGQGGTETLIPGATFPQLTVSNAQISDSKTYRVRTSAVGGTCFDGLAADVTVAVRDCAKAITANDDHAVTDSKTPVTIDVLVNDDTGTLNKSTDVAVAVYPANDPKYPQHGSVIVNLDHTITYTPTDPDWSGIDQFKYNVIENNDPTNYSETTVYVVVIKPLAAQFMACENELVTLGVNPILNVAFDWYKEPTSGSIVAGGSGTNTLSVSKNALGTMETWWVEPKYNDGTATIILPRIRVDLYASPTLMYWSRNAANNNWNDPSNWEDFNGNPLHAIPHECTDVHIPGNATNYPSLDAVNTPRDVLAYNGGKPVCNDITYHFGAEVAKPQELAYRQAYVQYNFGRYTQDQADGIVYNADQNGAGAVLSAQMNRDRYYALAAPLKSMVTGDFSLGGFPNMYQRAFKTAEAACKCGELEGQWYSPNNTMSLPLDARMNYSVSLMAKSFSAGALGQDNQRGLNLLNGVVEIPYFNEDIAAGVNDWDQGAHRLHKYESGSSKFRYYYSDQNGFPLAPESRYLDIVPRDKESYRFIFDGMDPFAMNVKITDGDTDGETDWIMVGNPFISSLDFNAFYTANSANIENYYYLFTGSNFELIYDPANIEGQGPLTANSKIASLQAFFIKPKGSVGGNFDLQFTEAMSVLRDPGSNYQLRSAMPSDVLRITAQNQDGTSWSDLIFGNGRNIRRLFAKDKPNSPQVYTIGQSIHKNIVQYVSGKESSIPLGIRSNSSGQFTFRFDNIENLHLNSLELKDKERNVSVDLLKNPTYTFVNASGNLSDRFELLFNRTYTGMAEISNENIRINVMDGVLYVASNERVSSVIVTNLQGSELFSEARINEFHFSKKMPFPAGVYIVKIILINGKTKVEKIVLR